MQTFLSVTSTLGGWRRRRPFLIQLKLRSPFLLLHGCSQQQDWREDKVSSKLCIQLWGLPACLLFWLLNWWPEQSGEATFLLLKRHGKIFLQTQQGWLHARVLFAHIWSAMNVSGAGEGPSLSCSVCIRIWWVFCWEGRETASESKLLGDPASFLWLLGKERPFSLRHQGAQKINRWINLYLQQAL